MVEPRVEVWKIFSSLFLCGRNYRSEAKGIEAGRREKLGTLKAISHSKRHLKKITVNNVKSK